MASRFAFPLRESTGIADVSLAFQKLKRIILDDELGICGDLDAEMDALVGTYVDEWAVAVKDPALRSQFKQFVNSVRPTCPDGPIALLTWYLTEREGARNRAYRGAWTDALCRLAQGVPGAEVPRRGPQDASLRVGVDPDGHCRGSSPDGGEHDVRSSPE